MESKSFLNFVAQVFFGGTGLTYLLAKSDTMMFTLLGNNYIFFLYKEPSSSYPSKMPGLSQEQKLEILILMRCFNPEFWKELDSSFVKRIPSLKLTYPLKMGAPWKFGDSELGNQGYGRIF